MYERKPFEPEPFTWDWKVNYSWANLENDFLAFFTIVEKLVEIGMTYDMAYYNVETDLRR